MPWSSGSRSPTQILGTRVVWAGHGAKKVSWQHCSNSSAVGTLGHFGLTGGIMLALGRVWKACMPAPNPPRPSWSSKSECTSSFHARSGSALQLQHKSIWAFKRDPQRGPQASRTLVPMVPWLLWCRWNTHSRWNTLWRQGFEPSDVAPCPSNPRKTSLLRHLQQIIFSLTQKILHSHFYFNSHFYFYICSGGFPFSPEKKFFPLLYCIISDSKSQIFLVQWILVPSPWAGHLISPEHVFFITSTALDAKNDFLSPPISVCPKGLVFLSLTSVILNTEQWSGFISK